MKKIRYEDVNAWSVMYFEIDDNRYDLTFFKRSLIHRLYILHEGFRWKVISSDLSEILDYLKERLAEIEFLQIQKFCFENM